MCPGTLAWLAMMPLRAVLLVEFPEALLPLLVHNNVDPGDGLANDPQIPCVCLLQTFNFFTTFDTICLIFLDLPENQNKSRTEIYGRI